MRTEQFLEGYLAGLNTMMWYLNHGATHEQLDELANCEAPYYDLPDWAIELKAISDIIRIVVDNEISHKGLKEIQTKIKDLWTELLEEELLKLKEKR